MITESALQAFRASLRGQLVVPKDAPRRSRSRSPGTTGAEHRPISSHLAHAVERAG